MQSKAATVAEYLKEQPESSRTALGAIRKMIRRAAPHTKEAMEDCGKSCIWFKRLDDLNLEGVEVLLTEAAGRA